MYATYRATSAGATVLIARGSIATAALRIRLKISTAACLACAPSRGGILGPASKTDTQHAVWLCAMRNNRPHLMLSIARWPSNYSLQTRLYNAITICQWNIRQTASSSKQVLTPWLQTLLLLIFSLTTHFAIKPYSAKCELTRRRADHNVMSTTVVNLLQAFTGIQSSAVQ